MTVLLDPAAAVILLLDHQNGLFQTVCRSPNADQHRDPREAREGNSFPEHKEVKATSYHRSPVSVTSPCCA